MRAARPVLVVVLLALLIGGNLWLPRWHDEQFRPPTAGRTRTDLLLDVLGEMRTFIARSLFIRADLYHHIMESQGISWRQERDILPIYRMVATLDPHLVDAYDTAAYDLVMNFGRPSEGLAFLEEGLRANPDSAQLYLSKAFLLFETKDYKAVVPAAGRAMQLATERVDMLNAIRLLTHSQERLKNREGEIHGLRLWLSLAPDDEYAKKQMRGLGLEPRGYTRDDLVRMGQGAPVKP